jgi:hypothetical protein
VACGVRDVLGVRQPDLHVYKFTPRGWGRTLLRSWVDWYWFRRLSRGTGLAFHEGG